MRTKTQSPTLRMFGLAVAAELFPGMAVLLCCDNKGAVQTLCRGTCRTELGRMLCATFWTLAATYSIPVWIESVAGALNPSDIPSRDCVLRTKPLVCPTKRCEVPAILDGILVSRSAVHLSQFSLAVGMLGFVQAWPRPN